MNKTISAIHYDNIPTLRTAPASTTLREIQEINDQSLIKRIASAVLPPKADDTHASSEMPCPTSDISEQYRCYRTYYSNMVSKISVEHAIKDLRARYDAKDIFAITQCHQLVHMIGRAAVDKYPTVSEAYTHGDAICWSGYYHGVMEGVMAKIGRDNITAHMNDICADIPGKISYSFDYYNCVHGLGHGVMYVKNNELFSSLDICDTLTGDWEKSSCIGGAFMENVIVDNLNHFTKYLKTDDPIYPCNAVDEKYKQPCYLMQTSYMLKLVNYDFSRIFDICAGVESKYIDTCYQSLGRDASGQSISSVEKTRATCLLGKDMRAQENCVIGAVKDFVAYHHSDVQAKQLCATFPAEQLRNTCDATAKSYYKAF